MNAKRLTTIAIAATLLIGGLAAVGAASPADTAAQNATNVSDAPAPDETNASDDPAPNETADDGADGVGPSDGLPEQAPDRVSEIHDAIESFLDGSDGDLGESLSELLSNGDATTDEGDADKNSDVADAEMS